MSDNWFDTKSTMISDLIWESDAAVFPFLNWNWHSRRLDKLQIEQMGLNEPLRVLWLFHEAGTFQKKLFTM